MDQLYILIIIGIISLVNWLIKRSGELREQRRLESKSQGLPDGSPYQPFQTEEPEPEPTQSSAGSPEEQMRRLMESLGLPMPEPEPVPIRPLPKKRPPESSIVQSVPPPPSPLRPPQKSQPKTLRESAPKTQNAWAKALASREGARQAIVLREILGPPKALDPRFSLHG